MSYPNVGFMLNRYRRENGTVPNYINSVLLVTPRSAPGNIHLTSGLYTIKPYNGLSVQLRIHLFMDLVPNLYHLRLRHARTIPYFRLIQHIKL